MAEDQVNLVPVRQLNLIPVGLKEAALDSPTFRATATHFGDQIDVVERWLDGYVKAASRLVAEATSFEAVVNTLLSQSTPPAAISEAVLDHDYTLLAMRRYAEGAREFWQNNLRGAKRFDSTVIEPIKAFLNSELKSFKDARRAMETAQRSFDNVVNRYLGQNKTKEASSLREDAFQLHEARKAYLKASMDFCVSAPQLRTSVDKLLVKVFAEQWKEMRTSREASSATFTKSGNEMERIRGWSREMENSERAFKRELAAARKQIEDSAESMARPSRELEDYAASTVPYLGTGASTTTGTGKNGQARPEKQGWLYLRTITGKPARTVWTRRWFFVKNGIFGWLVQGSRSGGVEESEKIGVLLCSVRPALQEERRFCFEVKTSDASIVLQAETQQELTDWISSFEVAKRKALEDPASTEDTRHAPGVDPAFAISPPVAPEFAAKPGDGHMSQGSEDASTGLAVPDRDSALATRASFDVNPGRRVMSADRENEGTRDHAARIIQKLDLHKRGSTTNQNIAPPVPSPGGIASLITASHSILPVGPGIPQASFDGTKRNFTLPTSSLAPSTLANPPAPTNLSHTAVVVSGERGIGLGRDDGSAVPSGILANLWGSSNWGSHVNQLDQDSSSSKETPPPNLANPRPVSVSQDDSVVRDGMNEGPNGAEVASSEIGASPLHRKTLSVGTELAATPAKDNTANEYPNYYPVPLKAQNAQFRMIFPQVPKAEKVVLVFRATWNPNEQQEFPGRVYVTLKKIYFFSNHLGLVLVTSVSLGQISEVTAAPGRDCDYIYLHLKETISGQDNSRRVAVKIFLEPLRLLQRRLNFLVHNSHESEPAGMESVLKTMIKMEVEKTERSSSIESWEDVAFDDDEARDSKNSPERRRDRNIKASLRIDGNLYGDPAKTGREIQKFKLPTQPVIYAPQGMQASVSRDFNISAKALFHVMFGDKSAVFQVVYCNHWADKIVQSPWIKTESGHWTRRFSSQHHATPLDDTQSIDIYNDHLCYVITNTKYPWRLPYSDYYTLVTKFVITHSSKSRSKLAIFQSIRWHKPPTIGYVKHLIEREAHNSLEADALDLTSVSMDQVSKLGSHSKTNKSIDIFGNIGQSVQAAQIESSQIPNLGGIPAAAREKQRRRISTSRLVTRDILSRLLGVVSMIFDIVVAVGRGVLSIFTTHTLLVIILLISVIYNSWYGYRDGLTWYHERSTTKFMSRIGVIPNPSMSKAIYLTDIDELVMPSLDNDTISSLSSSRLSDRKTCKSTFSEELFLSASPVPTSHSATRLSRSRDALAHYRHDLLVALRVINRIEKDVVLAEWDEWVRGEERNCRRIEHLLRQRRKSHTDEKLQPSDLDPASIDAELGDDFVEYCNSCRQDLAHLAEGVDLI